MAVLSMSFEMGFRDFRNQLVPRQLRLKVRRKSEKSEPEILEELTRDVVRSDNSQDYYAYD